MLKYTILENVAGHFQTKLEGDFVIYKGQLMWYGENDLLKKVKKYGKEEKPQEVREQG